MSTINIDDLKYNVTISHSFEELMRNLKLVCCTSYRKKLKKLATQHNIDCGHFDPIYANKSRAKYDRLQKICPVCKNIFITKNNRDEKTYCSYKCSNSLSLGNRHCKETSEKISKSLSLYDSKTNRGNIHRGIKKLHELICKGCQTPFNSRHSYQQYCSIMCARTSPEVRKKLSDRVQENIRNGKHQGWTSRNILSYPEKFFKNVFEVNGYANAFITNYPVKKKGLGIDCSACYFLDFYFPQFNLDIEIDGKQHNFSERKMSDELRDSKLIENGYKVYRIKWKSAVNDTVYIAEEIKKMLEYMASLED
jgi:hypothetical protein